jgi:uncharacterized protein (TIGR03083 family)
MTTSDRPGGAAAPVDHRAAVAAESERFVALVTGADPDTPVPTCPGWTLTDLVRHAGSVQRWFAVLLRQRVQEPPRSRDVDLRLPEHADGYAAWLAESATVAADAFATVDPDEPMWAWGADQHARFWARRMLFETLVHHADAEIALGRRPRPDRALAVDGVDEFLVNLPFAALFAPKVAHLRAENRTIRFACADGDESWLVRLRPDGLGVEAGSAADGEADATVRAGAADLLLVLYGRLDRTADGVEAVGDEALLDTWFANSEF